MVKYIIEDNLDFYDELYKSISIKEKEESNQCLITNTTLTENYITMECGHKFNYIPLYNDILNHKKKFNNMENKILKNIEIRCPYCRKVQQNLLPYHKYPGVKEVHGVNYFDESVVLKNPCLCCNSNMKFIIGTCEYDMEEGQKCINTSVLLLDENKKYYCLYHKYKMANILTKKIKLDKIAFKKKQQEDEKQKKKNDAKILKENIKKIKDDAKIAKNELKEINKKVKENTKKIKNENENINPNENVVLTVIYCTQILKKGGSCLQKQHTGTLCLRHHNLQNKLI